MERHDIDHELAIPGAQELLTSASMTRLAYLGPDGTPRVIPIGFYWTGDQVVVSTAATAPKVAALQARPDVALTSTPGKHPTRPGRFPSAGAPASRSSTAYPRSTWPAPGRSWTPAPWPSSSRPAARCTTRWRGSRSRRAGCGTSTSVPGAYRASCRTWPGRASADDGGAAARLIIAGRPGDAARSAAGQAGGRPGPSCPGCRGRPRRWRRPS
jgi:hypothetical protein